MLAGVDRTDAADRPATATSADAPEALDTPGTGAPAAWLAAAAREIDVDGYLRRLGIDRRPEQADVATLRRLHRAQVERIAYENLDIQLGRHRSIDPRASVGHVLAGRGGYCYALNGAFSLLLTALGYRVTWHRAGVQGHAAPEPPGPALANHLALTVDGLPAAEAPDGAWLVDAGLGDAIHEPVPLRTGTHQQGPLTFGLRPSEVAPGGWRLDHDPRGSFVGMDFGPAAATVDDFLERDTFLSTAPKSGFVRTSIVQRRDAGGSDQLRGCLLTRVDARPEPGERLVDTEEEWFEALVDVFGLALPDLDGADRRRLWARVRAGHDQWVAEQAP